MKLKKIISVFLAVSMIAAFAATASAELVASPDNNVTITQIPTAAEFAARANTVDTVVTELTEADAGMPAMELYDAQDNEINVFDGNYKVYKISNTFKVGAVASKMAAKYCGVYAVSTTYKMTADQKANIFTDAYDQVGIKYVSNTDLLKAQAGVDGENFNMFATAESTTYDKLYPGKNQYVADASVVIDVYVVLKKEAPALTLEKVDAEVIYYAKNTAATVVENAVNKPTMLKQSITLGETQAPPAGQSAAIKNTFDGTTGYVYNVEVANYEGKDVPYTFTNDNDAEDIKAGIFGLAAFADKIEARGTFNFDVVLTTDKAVTFEIK